MAPKFPPSSQAIRELKQRRRRRQRERHKSNKFRLAKQQLFFAVAARLQRESA